MRRPGRGNRGRARRLADGSRSCRRIEARIGSRRHSRTRFVSRCFRAFSACFSGWLRAWISEKLYRRARGEGRGRMASTFCVVCRGSRGAPGACRRRAEGRRLHLPLRSGLHGSASGRRLDRTGTRADERGMASTLCRSAATAHVLLDQIAPGGNLFRGSGRRLLTSVGHDPKDRPRKLPKIFSKARCRARPDSDPTRARG